MFARNYADVFAGDTRWNAIVSPDGERYAWDGASTYIKNPPYFDGMATTPGHIADIHAARRARPVRRLHHHDHISPAGSIKKDSPAGHYLQARGVAPVDFNATDHDAATMM